MLLKHQWKKSVDVFLFLHTRQITETETRKGQTVLNPSYYFSLLSGFCIFHYNNG